MTLFSICEACSWGFMKARSGWILWRGGGGSGRLSLTLTLLVLLLEDLRSFEEPAEEEVRAAALLWPLTWLILMLVSELGRWRVWLSAAPRSGRAPSGEQVHG